VLVIFVRYQKRKIEPPHAPKNQNNPKPKAKGKERQGVP